MTLLALYGGSTYTVFVNKRSGMAHRRRDCEWLRKVPDGALRRVIVEDGQPRFRYCSACAVNLGAEK